MKRMMLITLAVLLCLAGCDTGLPDPLPVGVPTNTKSVAKFSAQGSAKASRPLDASFIPESLFFGEVEIVGYDYRPGAAVQSNLKDWGMSNPDWSYWGVRLAGSPAMADNILEAGKTLVLDPAFQQPFNDAYFKSVESFDLDMLEVYTVGFGLVKGGKFYTGQMYNSYYADKKALYKYPTLDAAVSYEPTLFTTDGTIPFWWGVSSIFVRSDWLTSPVTVYSEEIYKITSTSRPLSAEEDTFIRNWMTTGCPSRRFSNIMTFIPYGSLKQIYLAPHTYDGVNSFIAGSVQLEVSFDFTKIIDRDKSSLDPMTSPPQPGLVSFGMQPPPSDQVYRTLRLYEDSTGKRFGLSFQLSSVTAQ